MTKKYFVKRFNTEEDACEFLNDLDVRSLTISTNYNRRMFDYQIISFHRVDNQIVVVYLIEQGV